MHFPFEVTDPYQIKIGDRVEITWNTSGDVVIGTIECTTSGRRTNGRDYTNIKVNIGGAARWLTVDNSVEKMGFCFSIRILGRKPEPQAVRPRSTRILNRKPEPVRPPIGTIVHGVARHAMPNDALYVPVRCISNGIDSFYAYQIIGYKED